MKKRNGAARKARGMRETRGLHVAALWACCVAGLVITALLAGCAQSAGARTAVVYFRGGGAEEGSVDPIEAEVGSTITLPPNGFTWKGHHFDGWVSTRDEGGKPLEPGTEVLVEDETVYEAVWRQPGISAVTFPEWDFESTWVDLEVGEGDTELVGTMGGWGGREHGGVIRITNKSDRNVDLESTLTLIQTSGHDWTSEQLSAYCLAPGSSRLLHVTDLHRSEGLRWTIEVAEPQAWKEPLEKSLTVEEVSADADHVTVRLTNTGTHVVQIASVRMVATTADGSEYAGDAFVSGRIDPGDALDATFAKDNMFEFEAFETFANTKRVYYVDGYANLNQ